MTSTTAPLITTDGDTVSTLDSSNGAVVTHGRPCPRCMAAATEAALGADEAADDPTPAPDPDDGPAARVDALLRSIGWPR